MSWRSTSGYESQLIRWYKVRALIGWDFSLKYTNRWVVHSCYPSSLQLYAAILAFDSLVSYSCCVH